MGGLLLAGVGVGQLKLGLVALRTLRLADPLDLEPGAALGESGHAAQSLCDEVVRALALGRVGAALSATRQRVLL